MKTFKSRPPVPAKQIALAAPVPKQQRTTAPKGIAMRPPMSPPPGNAMARSQSYPMPGMQPPEPARIVAPRPAKLKMPKKVGGYGGY